MTSTPSPTTPPRDPDAEALSNPHTPAAELARIAATRPDLHPAIAAHPHCYPALHQWITHYQATTTTNPTPTTGNQAPAAGPAAGLAPANTPAPATVPTTAGTTTPRSDQAQTTPYLAPTTGTSTPTTTSNQTPGTTHPQGPSRRTINRALPLLAGGAALATLGGISTWGLSHYLSEEPQDPTEEEPQTKHRTFSISALSPDFARGATRSWSIDSFRGMCTSPQGDYVFGLYGTLEDTEPSSYRLYPISGSGVGEPVEVAAAHWDWDDFQHGHHSVHTSWWGSYPLLVDKIIDPRSGGVTPVPWDTSSHVFLGALDNDTALLLKVPPYQDGDGAAAEGPIIAVNRQMQETWRTNEAYVLASFDPARPDVLIGYRSSRTRAGGNRDTITPHLIDITTGATTATLTPLVELSERGIILATDGVVVVTTAPEHTAQARAFGWDGALQWEQTGQYARIVFDGVPSVDVVQRSLTSLNGATAVVAENGVALVQNGDGTFSRRGDAGDAGPSLSLGDDNIFSGGRYKIDFTVLADGSAAVCWASRRSSVNLVDASTGRPVQDIPSAVLLSRVVGLSWDMDGKQYASLLPGVQTSSLGDPGHLLVMEEKGTTFCTTCYVPA